MPDFDFDQVIDRREVPALKFHQTVLATVFLRGCEPTSFAEI